MNHLWNLVRKELKELMTPASVISILVVALLFGSMGGLLGSETEKMSEPPTIGVLSGDETGSYYMDARTYIDDFYLTFYKTDPAAYVRPMDPGLYDTFTGTPDVNAVTAAMNALEVSVLIVFDKDYSTNIEGIANNDTTVKQGYIRIYWNDVSTGVFGSVSTVIVGEIISYINQRTAQSIIGSGAPPAFGHPSFVQSPIYTPMNYTVFNGKVFERVTPQDISGALQSQSFLMPILMMIIITMIGSMIISSMGNEKENKTLETLLTLPVKRTTIVGGKLIGSAIAGLIFGMFYLAGMYFYMNSVWGAGTLSLSDLGLTLSLFDWGIVTAVIFLAILSALGLCMILGAFVKNYKAAQTLTLPISMLAMIPMFVTMFTDFNTLPVMLQVFLFAIPFTHPMLIMNNLMLGDTFMVWAGLGYLAVFALVMIFITVRIYRSDILLTGLVKKNRKKGISSIFSKIRP
ncbi:MAG: ABC transporter permease [Methanomassiliicoccaceae archaeon]|jgi:ABC-2 type transport system permease protein|nr:ABC transporter permease [Methanomassiliicoccaceae archaeon]